METEIERARLPRLPPKSRALSPRKPTSAPTEDLDEASVSTPQPTRLRASASNTRSTTAERLSAARARRPAAQAAEDTSPIVYRKAPAITRRQTRERFPDPETPAEEPMPMVAGMAPEPTGVPPRKAILRSRAAEPTTPDQTTRARRAKRVSFGADIEEPAEPASSDAEIVEPVKTPKRKRRLSSVSSVFEAPLLLESPRSPRTRAAAAAEASTEVSSEATSSEEAEPAPTQAVTRTPRKAPRTPKRRRGSVATPSTPVNNSLVDDAISRALARRGFLSSQLSSQSSRQSSQPPRQSSEPSHQSSQAESEPATPEPATQTEAVEAPALMRSRSTTVSQRARSPSPSPIPHLEPSSPVSITYVGSSSEADSAQEESEGAESEAEDFPTPRARAPSSSPLPLWTEEIPEEAPSPSPAPAPLPPYESVELERLPRLSFAPIIATVEITTSPVAGAIEIMSSSSVADPASPLLLPALREVVSSQVIPRSESGDSEDGLERVERAVQPASPEANNPERQQLEDLKKEHDRLHRQMEAERAKLERLKRKYDQVRVENRNKQHRIDELEDQLREMEELGLM